MKNRKIVFYTQVLEKGGAERVISNLANNLAKRGNIVSIILNVKSNICYDIDKKIKIYEIDSKTYNPIVRKIKTILRGRNRKLNVILDDIKPDVVISFLPESNMRCLERKKYKTIISIRNNPENEFSFLPFKYKMTKLFPKADGFVFQTTDAQNYFKGFIKDKGRIIYNPVSSKFYNNCYIGDEDSIVTVGRLYNQKNHYLLIDAFEKILIRFPSFKLKIYGEGPLKNSLYKYITKKGLNDNVLLMGNIDDVERTIIHSKVFVLSSNYEGMPNCLIEAMTLGMPCVSTDCPCGGPKELIKSNYNGLLVPIKDVDLMSDAIEKLLEDKKFRKTISKNAKEIYKVLNEDHIVDQWIDYLNYIIEKNEKN